MREPAAWNNADVHLHHAQKGGGAFFVNQAEAYRRFDPEFGKRLHEMKT